jgi:uncharacterized protein (UPF0335 family)
MSNVAAANAEPSPNRFAKEHLKAFVERIERLEEEKKAIGDDVRDVYAEAKANGFDTKALRAIVRLRQIHPQLRGRSSPSVGCSAAVRACAAEFDRRHKGHRVARKFFNGHSGMRIVGKCHFEGGCRLEHVLAEITEILRPEQGGFHVALRARTDDHGAHPGIIESIADPHVAAGRLSYRQS